MIDRFNDFIDSNKLFTKDEPLLLALSGGADSLALFYLLKGSGYTFGVAHVNYSLRGEESNEDEAFVASLCKKYGIRFHLNKIKNTYWKKGMNTQGEARKIRYSYFDEIINSEGYSKVVTAHHKDDNTETILMNITRGTGLKGLMGLEKVQGNVVRPLLFVEREEIEAYLRSNKLAWREDSSNTSDKYKRNRFRNEIIPLLKKENPALNDAIDRLVENLASVSSSFTHSLADFKETYYKDSKEQVKIETSSKDQLTIYLFDVLSEFDFNRTQVNAILTSINEVGKKFISSTHELFIDRKEIIIVAKEAETLVKFEIFENTTAIIDPIILKFNTLLDGKIEKAKGVELIDKEKIQFPLILRKWQEGDRIQPLGMKGSKKVSDILIDRKINRADKQKVMVLESNDEIICIPGIMLSDKVKIESDTTVFWRVELLI